MYIKLNNKNQVIWASTITDQNEDEMELSDENSKLLLNDLDNFGFYRYSNGLLTKDTTKQLEMETNRNINIQLVSLRSQRQIECFSIINQIYVIDGVSKTWFDTLTDEQKEEATAWVQAWRDVTETLVEPEKPSWL